MIKRKATLLLGMGLTLTAIFFSLPSPVRSQTGNPGELLKSAEAEIADGFYKEALPKLEQVSLDAPLTEEDLYSRLDRAYYYFGAQNKEASKQLYTSIIRDFPDRSEATIARINLADIRYIDEGGNFQTYLTELDSIALSLGGPKVSSIAGGGNGQIRTVSGLTAEAQSAALAELYNTAASRFVAKKAGTSKNDIEQNLNLLVFMAETFPGVLQEGFEEQLVEAFQRRDGNTSFDTASDRTPPKISTLKVRPKEKGGDYVVVTSVGDNLLIFPSSVEITLDGQKLTGSPVLRFRPMHKNVKQLKANSLRIVLKQTISNLSPGRHQVVCTATDGVGNISTKTRYFRVKNRDSQCDFEDFDSEDENGDDF